MYGSIHTHFESRYDTGNDMYQMVTNFIESGAKRVAVTEHGVFSSYEDLRDIVEEIKKKAKEEGSPVPDFEIIPGIEGYFGDEASHLILIAKDYEGYLSLCKIITESNKNIVNDKPIITMENLQRNVRKGHLICTTACIAGPFGHLLGLDYYNLVEKIDRLREDLEQSGYNNHIEFVNEYTRKEELYKELCPKKSEIKAAESIAKKTGDNTALLQIEERIQEAEEIKAWLDEHKESFEKAQLTIKQLGSAVYARKKTTYEKYVKELAEIDERIACGEIEAEAQSLFKSFKEIFGENDFYFELQNHGLSQEYLVYNNVISFAHRVMHPRFIASNDIHLGVRKDDPAYLDMLQRRNVAKFNRFKKYEEETEDDKEYTIKSDEELAEELRGIIEPVRQATEVISSEEIISQAISNIKTALSECSIEFPKDKNHYPKFCNDEDAEFERKVREGIKKRFPNGFPGEEYSKRLEYEMDIIKTMGFSGYHLIVADYLTYGRLLGYLPTAEEIANAPLTIEELDNCITEKGYPRIGYSIGPGRGSAVGSLCCYALGITDIDPIPYGLLFERFLNVERVSMPDIDSDFRTDIREKVVEYCRAKYGAECLCQIMTKSYNAIKGNLRLAARYLGSVECEQNPEYVQLREELQEVNKNLITEEAELRKQKDVLQKKISEIKKVSKTLPSINDLSKEIKNIEEQIQEIDAQIINIKGKAKSEKERLQKKMDDFLKSWTNRADKLAKLYDSLGKNLPDESTLSPEEARIVELAQTLDGIFMGYGEHAAGTIISGEDISNVIPLRWNSEKKAMETQCTMAQAEAKGLLKMDFLGLKNLNIITEIIRHPTKKEDMDGRLQDYEERNKILRDPSIYRDIFCTGYTQGIFQFESPGMKKLLMDFQPESFEDIILLVATYRPGPIDYIPEIIASKWYEKNGQKGEAPKKSITLQNETLANILKPTYGCPIYQEQIMMIFQQMAGYSLGGADIVRRYMSKKKYDKLAKEKDTFIYGDEKRGIPGCMKLHGISEKDASDLFEQMMPFANYGFNKSHAAAYATVAVFTAYLKKYHTADFFRSSLNAIDKITQIPEFVKEMPFFGLTIKPPSMQNSKNTFTVEDDGKVIRYGLRYVKGFPEQHIQRYSSIQEFIQMNPNVSLNMIEKYIHLGMFEECWAQDKKTSRVRGNRHECLRWLEKNGTLFLKYLEQVEKTEALEQRQTELEQALVSVDSPEEEQLLIAELNKVLTQHKQWMAKRKESASWLNENYKEDKMRGVVPRETAQEILENRKWEIDYLAMPFDIKQSLLKIFKAKNQNTFSSLNISKENNGGTLVRVPAIVLSVSEMKKTKNGSNYFEVSLMDREKKIITRRFNQKPEILDGEFLLTIDECKFFACPIKGIKPIMENNPKKSFLPQNSDSQTKTNAVCLGGNIEQIQIAGGKKVSVVFTQQESLELEERD